MTIDVESQRRFDAERRTWFPPGRTVIGAHVTLFHALPGLVRERVEADITAVCAEKPVFEINVSAVISLGRGVAYQLTSAELSVVHRILQKRWWAELTPQDRQGYRPHVTIQNKASVDVARQTLAVLQTEFAPFTARAEGLRLWRYDNGPWTSLREFSFGVSPIS